MSRPSDAQLEANRRNAKHSRGPNSIHGKQRSSQNALRHGLTGRVVVLPTEDMQVYLAFSKELVDSLDPQTPMESQLAQTVADTQWRLNRARTFEDGMLAMGNFEAAGDFDAATPNIHAALTAAKVFRDHSRDFLNLSLYEQRLQRAQKESYRQLRELQAERKARTDMPVSPAASAPPQALTQTATAGLVVTESSPDPDAVVSGFVYSSTETDLPTARPFPAFTPEKRAA